MSDSILNPKRPGGLPSRTMPCNVCSKDSTVYLTPQEWHRMTRGERLAEIFPNTPLGEIELMISGTHDACWDELYGDDDE